MYWRVGQVTYTIPLGRLISPAVMLLSRSPMKRRMRTSKLAMESRAASLAPSSITR